MRLPWWESTVYPPGVPVPLIVMPAEAGIQGWGVTRAQA